MISEDEGKTNEVVSVESWIIILVLVLLLLLIIVRRVGDFVVIGEGPSENVWCVGIRYVGTVLTSVTVCRARATHLTATNCWLFCGSNGDG